MEIQTRNFSYLKSHGKWNCWRLQSHRELILLDTTLSLPSGSLCCVLGTKGANDALLHIISCRPLQGFASGKILYDGAERARGYYKDICVHRFDESSKFGDITVFEFFTLSAHMRADLTEVGCREQSREIIRLLGLDGSLKINLLSVGQYRLMEIGINLISHPKLLLLDNPVRELETGDSVFVVSALKRIVMQRAYPVTIIFSADSLNKDLFTLVSNIYVVAGCRLVISCGTRKLYDAISLSNESADKYFHLLSDVCRELSRRSKSLPETSVEDNVIKIIKFHG